MAYKHKSWILCHNSVKSFSLMKTDELLVYNDNNLTIKERRRRFRIGTRQWSWTRPIAWELIPMMALWVSKGGAQLSQHTAQVGWINRLYRYTCSPGHRAYCCAELVSSLAMALTTASTHFTIPQTVEGWVDLVGWLRTVDSHPSKY